MKTAIVYSTPTCVWCNRTKEYLRQNHVDFVDLDVSRNREAAQEMVKKSGQMGVPVLEIDGNIIVGFDRRRIDQLLDL